MTFAEQLQAAKGDLTARQVAAAVSPLLSVRTVEDWLANRRSPPAWTQEWIISRVRGDLCAPKKARSQKGQNAEVCDGHQSQTHKQPNSERGARSQH